MGEMIRVAAAQLGPSESIRQISHRIQALLMQARDDGIALAVFPELALTPYYARWRPESAPIRLQPVVGTEELEALGELVQRYRVAAVIPLARRDDMGHVVNSAAIFDSQGKIAGFYDKVHLPRAVKGPYAIYEREWFTAGDHYPTFLVDAMRLGIQICYDRHFPEGFEAIRTQGAQIVGLSSNSPLYGSQSVWRRMAWQHLCRVRAHDTQMVVIAACKAGTEFGWDYIGSSCVVDAAGNVLATAQTNGDELVAASIQIQDSVPNHLKGSKVEPHSIPIL